MPKVVLQRHDLRSHSSSSLVSEKEALPPFDPPLQNSRFEALYCWVASEESHVLVVGGPSAVLENALLRRPFTPREDSVRKSSFLTTRQVLGFKPTRLVLPTGLRINDQSAFRNPAYPLEGALAAVILCAQRWGPERNRLCKVQSGDTPTSPLTSKAGIIDTPDFGGPLRDSEGAKCLREADVITSRRALRHLLRFLDPTSTPYSSAFSIDVDIVGKSLILTFVTDQLKTVPAGYGANFEETFSRPAFLNTTQVPATETGHGKKEQLTTMYVVRSLLLCGELRLIISAETDAVDEYFNPLAGELPATACCSSSSNSSSSNSSNSSNSSSSNSSNSSNSSSSNTDEEDGPSTGGSCPDCTYAQTFIGDYECFVHSCRQLSLLEHQLLRGSAPTVEIKSHSVLRLFHFEDAADQMRLGGAQLLFKGVHDRGTLTEIAMYRVEQVVEKAKNMGADERKWSGLCCLLKNLHQCAADARKRAGKAVGCVRVTFDGVSSFLEVVDRPSSALRISSEAAEWLAEK